MKTKNIKNLSCILSVALIAPSLLTPLTTIAAEINYSHIIKVSDAGVNIVYKGPWINSANGIAEQNFFCPNASTSCNSAVAPLPNQVGEFEMSPSGKLGVKQLNLNFGITQTSFYSVYDFSSGSQNFKGLISFYEPVQKIVFSPDESAIVLLGNNKVARYDTRTQATFTTSETPTEFASMSLSPDATWMSSYNYVTQQQGLWNLKAGIKKIIPTASPSLIAFSDSENKLAYVDKNNGFTSLFIIDDLNVPNWSSVLVSDGKSTVADYIFVGESLFYLANEFAPYSWSLYSVDSAKNKKIVDDNVSYGDYLYANDQYLYYSKVEGKNSNIWRYNADTQIKTRLEAVSASPADSNVSKTALTIAGRSAALWKSTNSTQTNVPLFIWLHGGPERQTSLDYHPYLSYAVYDELLERLVDSGAIVLKLDYTGSYGYGQSFIDALKGNVGKADVADVLNSITELKQKESVGNVYLIGNSYGGYLALRTLAESPSQVNGAVSINGVTDWYTLLTRIPSSPFKTQLGLPNTTESALSFLQASIVARLSKIQSQKMILLYGEDDATVPTWQSTDFYNVAKALGKNVELISYANEDHIPRQRDTLNNICASIANGLGLSGVNCSN